MPITKQKKSEIIDTLSASLEGVSTIVFVEFKKLSVADAIELRRRLRDAGVGYMVSKKTLLKRVLNDAGFTGEMPDLTGQTAIAFSADPLAPAREVYAFQKERAEFISIIGGVYDKAFVSKEAMTSIAMIPPLPVLRGQFVGMLMSPIRSFVLTLDQIAKSKTA